MLWQSALRGGDSYTQQQHGRTLQPSPPPPPPAATDQHTIHANTPRGPRPPHLHIKALHSNRPRLAHAPRAPHSLCLECRVEAGLQQEDVAGSSEVDAWVGVMMRAHRSHSGVTSMLVCWQHAAPTAINIRRGRCEGCAAGWAQHASVKARCIGICYEAGWAPARVRERGRCIGIRCARRGPHSPTAPLRMESRKTSMGSRWKASIALVRLLRGMEPGMGVRGAWGVWLVALVYRVVGLN